MGKYMSNWQKVTLDKLCFFEKGKTRLANFGKIFSKIFGTTILLKLEIYRLKTAESDITKTIGKINRFISHNSESS
jgi:hypothetical protein